MPVKVKIIIYITVCVLSWTWQRSIYIKVCGKSESAHLDHNAVLPQTYNCMGKERRCVDCAFGELWGTCCHHQLYQIIL